MHWILQENLFKETEWDTLVLTLERFHIPYSVHKVVPFVGELIPPAEPKCNKVICFGSYSMRHSAYANKWQPGVYDLFNYNFIEQLEHWGEHLLNHDSEIREFKDVKITAPAFIRPSDDTKYFAGMVFDPVYFHEWQMRVCDPKNDYGTSLTPNTLVQVCLPKEIYEEYRYWIVNGKIITRSLYKRGRRVIYSAGPINPELDDFVEARIGEWCPHKAFVIDVCVTPHEYRIVEINTINSAGFYAGNIPDIIMSIELMEEYT